jgi:hypothetical protein
MKYPALFVFLAALASVVPLANAHFKLLEPSSWITENNLGDPQKLGPCGGTTADSGTPTGVVNQLRGGAKLHLKLQETVFHPGHYRVALAASPAELPPDVEVVTRDSDKGPRSVSAPIQSPPKFPVLADGLFVHTAKATEPFETDVDIPNINCEKCTLQITEFMAEHGYNKDGGYHYHHCATCGLPRTPPNRSTPAGR